MRIASVTGIKADGTIESPIKPGLAPTVKTALKKALGAGGKVGKTQYTKLIYMDTSGRVKTSRFNSEDDHKRIEAAQKRDREAWDKSQAGAKGKSSKTPGN
jgi:hypothetical protein